MATVTDFGQTDSLNQLRQLCTPERQQLYIWTAPFHIHWAIIILIHRCPLPLRHCDLQRECKHDLGGHPRPPRLQQVHSEEGSLLVATVSSEQVKVPKVKKTMTCVRRLQAALCHRYHRRQGPHTQDSEVLHTCRSAWTYRIALAVLLGG